MSVHLCGGDGDAGDLDIFCMTPFMRLMKYGYPLSSFSIILFMSAGATHLKNCCFASHSDNLAMKTRDPISNITSHLRSFNFFSNCCELLHCMHGSCLLTPTHIQVYAHTGSCCGLKTIFSRNNTSNEKRYEECKGQWIHS